MAKKAETPLMTQYGEMKKKHPDAVLLFRIGNFYECFKEDAIVASEILGITVTRCTSGKAPHVERAVFPHHALDTYLPMLVRVGKRVAICEQLEDPKLAKKSVKRGITELVTPSPLNQKSYKPALSLFAAFSSILSAFCEAFNIILTFEEIRRHTKEIRTLAGTIGISPIMAFKECNTYSQLSLFD